jgi:hypothetical protein
VKTLASLLTLAALSLPLWGCAAHADAAAALPAASSGSPVDWADAWLAGWTGRAQGSNRYAHESDGEPLYVFWSSDAGSGGQFSNLSDCSYFGSSMLKRSYGWTDAGLQNWLCQGSCRVGRPQASHFHDAIAAQNHFAQIQDIRSIARGDIIAIRYSDRSKDTGHFMLVQGAPTAICTDCSPMQYSVAVDDSAIGYHGAQDTRYTPQACHADSECAGYSQAVCDSASHRCSYTGIGRGFLRLYADSQFRISGYSWSTAASSTPYMTNDSPLLRHVVVGRYDGSAGY